MSEDQESAVAGGKPEDYPLITLYKDSAGEYRWRRTEPNGEVTGASSEGYTRAADAIRNIMRTCKYPYRIQETQEDQS